MVVTILLHPWMDFVHTHNRDRVQKIYTNVVLFNDLSK